MYIECYMKNEVSAVRSGFDECVIGLLDKKIRLIVTVRELAMEI